MKEVDWIPYLTTHLVDDAASHLRLYRSALAKTKENSNSDLVSVFFDFEATMEKNLCRDMVCTDDSHLQGNLLMECYEDALMSLYEFQWFFSLHLDYLQGLNEALLYLLLPQKTFSCTPVGALLQDMLVNYVFVPMLQLFSDPDFVNQCIIWLVRVVFVKFF